MHYRRPRLGRHGRVEHRADGARQRRARDWHQHTVHPARADQADRCDARDGGRWLSLHSLFSKARRCRGRTRARRRPLAARLLPRPAENRSERDSKSGAGGVRAGGRWTARSICRSSTRKLSHRRGFRRLRARVHQERLSRRAELVSMHRWSWEESAGQTDRIEQPALMITAELDVVLRPEMAEGMKTWVPNLRKTVLVKGSGHWTQQEKPAEVNAAILDFLSDLKK